MRGSISSEMWETFNSTWLEARATAPSALHGAQRRRVHRLGEVPRPPRARRRARLDAARRGLPLHADRHVPRARRRGGAPAADPARLRGDRRRPASPSRTTTCPGPCCCARCPPSRSSAASRATASRRCTSSSSCAFRPDVPRSLLRSAELVFENLRLVANTQSGETERRAGRAARDAALRHARDARRRQVPSRSCRTCWRAPADLSDRIGRDFLGHVVPG